MEESAGTAYHLQGTVVMGRPNDTNACVGSDFVVYGLNNLRVADLSIAPTNVKYIFRSRLVHYRSDPRVVRPSTDMTCLAITRKARLI